MKDRVVVQVIRKGAVGDVQTSDRGTLVRLQ